MAWEMEKQGLIKPSTSLWLLPIVLAKKKDETFLFYSLRMSRPTSPLLTNLFRNDIMIHMCVHYRRLNVVTVSDAHPMGNLHDVIRNMKGAQIFNLLDLKSGY